jgi:hypothetical protein
MSTETLQWSLKGTHRAIYDLHSSIRFLFFSFIGFGRNFFASSRVLPFPFSENGVVSTVPSASMRMMASCVVRNCSMASDVKTGRFGDDDAAFLPFAVLLLACPEV